MTITIKEIEAINHEGAKCIAFASFAEATRETGVFRNAKGGWDVVLAEINGEGDPAELSRRNHANRFDALVAFSATVFEIIQ
jgi:hypothetical protein